MGTINYKTSDYITLGVRPYDTDDFIKDPDFMEYAKEQEKMFGISAYDLIQEEIQDYYETDLGNVKIMLEKLNLYYYHITIEPGYYEGFHLMIENNFGVAYDSYEDRNEAQKEITRIKKFLLDCAGCGIVQVFPGWCMGYADYAETVNGINEAIKTMRREVKSIPTWLQYERACY